jgi:hypothetical protein
LAASFQLASRVQNRLPRKSLNRLGAASWKLAATEVSRDFVWNRDHRKA